MNVTTPASTDSARVPRMAGQSPIYVLQSMVVRRWRLAFIGLLLLSGVGQAWAQAGGSLVANLERIDPSPSGAPIPAPGYATYVLKATNTSATNLARNVRVTHTFGPDALYDVMVTCQAYGAANCPNPGNVDIHDGRDAGRVEITIPVLPRGGGLNGNQHRLEFTIRGVVRGYPNPIGTISHRVRAIDDDGDQSTLVQIQDTLSVPAEGNLRSWVTKTLDTPVPDGVPWDTELEYTLRFINDGDVPMPLPVFADHHRLRDGTPSETYTSIDPITNGSRVLSCQVVGGKPADAPSGSQGCPYQAGENWGPLENDLRPVLPRRNWNQVLYPGQSIEVRVAETINAPTCLAHDSGDVDSEGRLVLNNRAYINYNQRGPDRIYRGDTGRIVVSRQLPMQPLPDCSVAELKFDLEEVVTSPNPANLGWGMPTSWNLKIQNVSDRDFGDVPVTLRSTLRSLGGSSTGARVQWRIASCTPSGGATCPWSAGSLPSGGKRFGGSGVHKVIFNTAGATIPQGGGLDIEVEIRPVAPGDACKVLRLQNSQWEVSVDNPPSSPILDSDGNEYDAWDIIGNTGGPNNSFLGQGNDPSLIATGNARVNYTTTDPDCESDGLKTADPAVTQSIAQAPIVGGNIVYDVIVTNTQGSPAISNVEVVDELVDSGIDLVNLGDFTLTCESAENGATCPTGVASGSVICQGAACPFDGSGTAWSLLIASLPVNGSVTIRVDGAFIGTEAGSEAGEYYNTASIQAGAGADYEDEDDGNNFSQLSSGATQPTGTLRLSKVLSGDEGYDPGDTFELSVTCGTFALEPITLAAGETRDVTVLADTSCIVEEAALPTPETGYIWEAPTYAPSATRTVPAEGVRTIEVTNTISPIAVDLQKTVSAVTEVSPGVREVTYTLTATNSSSAATTYSLQDFFRPEADVIPVAGYPQASYVAGGDGLDTSVGFPRIVTDEGIAAGGVDTYQVVVRYTTGDPDDPANNVCTGTVENGLFNRALLTTIGGSRESADACADNPYRAMPTVAKELVAQSGGTSEAFAEPGEQLTYRITVGNPGTVALEDVAVVDTIPANTGFVSADNGGTEAGNEVQWTVDVPAGGSTVLTVVFQVNDSVPAGVRQIANNVTANDETCVTTPCVSTPFAEPALVVSKQLTGEDGSTAGVAEPGETLTYTITVTNTSDDVGATGASIIDITPEHTTPSLPAGSDGSVNGDGNVEWTLDVNAGQAVTRTVQFQVASPLPGSVESIENNVTVNDAPCTTVPCVSTPTAEAELVISKQLTGESGGTQAGIAEPGEDLTYTITLQNVSDVDVTGVEVLDPVPANATLVSVGNGGTQDADGASWIVDVEAGGSVDLTVTFKVDGSLSDGVEAIVNNVTANDQGCATTPCVSTPTPEADLTISKQLTGEDGEQADTAEPGEALTYTITVTNVSGVSAADVSVVDITPAHTTLSLPPGSDGVVNADGNAEWTLDIGANDSITRTVIFTVDDNLPAGVEQIANNATVNGAPCAAVPCVSTPVAEPVLSISKELTDEDGTQTATAEPGEQLTYTIAVTNESDVAAAGATVVDPLPANTEFVAASNGGAFADGQVRWTIPQIQAGGTVLRTVTFRVVDTIAADVEHIINNATVNDLPCAEQPCVSTPLSEAELAIEKALTNESGELPGYVEPGEQLTYIIAVENIGGVGATDARVEDVLPLGARFVSADAGGTFQDGAVVWTVDVAAGESVALELVVAMEDILPSGRNAVVNNATVNGVSCTDIPCVQTPVASPPVAVDDDSGDHLIGDRAVISVLENDRIGSAELDPTSVWIEGAAAAGEGLTVSGEGVWSIDPQIGVVTFTPNAGFTDDPSSIRYSIADAIGMRSNQATITLDYVQDTVLRLSKVASARTAMIGDLLRYTLTIENVGTSDVTGATLLDVPPQGFALLPESVRVIDGDGASHPASTAPLRVEQIDIAVGETATVTYFMAVGATALPGAHTNEAVMLLTSTAPPMVGSDQSNLAAAIDTRGAVSNVATATVILESDPLFEQALILGTVFDDRDADGWQDSAEATGVTLRGLPASGYVPGSLTVDRGAGPQPLAADASADGIELGRLPGRSTIAEAEDANRIVISQRMQDASTDGGITVATAQGTTVHLAPDGTTRTDRDGDAAKGLTAQDIRVRRVVTPGSNADRVDYIITNAGVQEQGIPGVRLGTLEGLLIETDAYGRYHLEGIETGHYARGSNFILKVDAATLPPGSELTTENPRIRRITPGMPVRFDFGVQVPEEVIEGGETIEELSLGEVLFEANSAQVRPEQRPVVARMAEVLTARGGGGIDVIGNGGDPELAYARAKAVADILDTELDEAIRMNTAISVRGEVDGPEVLTLGDRIIIGEVFFDTDSTEIKPEYAGLLADIAEDIEAGGIPHLLITGHADRRASDTYNLALGKRRAEAVHAAIAAHLSQQRREQLQIEYMPPTKQAPAAGQVGGQKEAN